MKEKCSSDRNRWKSVGDKSGEYGGCGRNFHLDDDIFSWICFAMHGHRFSCERIILFLFTNAGHFQRNCLSTRQVVGN